MTKKIITFLTAIMITASSASFAQNSPYHMYDFDMRVKGSSNVRDWETVATELHLDLRFDENKPADFIDGTLTDLKLRVPVKKITSSTPGLIRNMRQALKADRHPEIIFNLDDIAESPQGKDNSRFTLSASGTLEIAGVERSTPLRVTGRKRNDDSIELHGSRKLRMTDFNIDPPTALLGAIRARNEIEVVFTVYLRAR